MSVNNKNRRFCLAVLIWNIFVCQICFSQNNDGNNVILLKRINYVQNSHNVEELIVSIKEIKAEMKDEGFFLVRICSQDILMRSVLFTVSPINGALNPILFANNRNDKFKNTFIGVSSKCEKSSQNGTTEVWWALSIDRFPPTQEIWNANELNITKLDSFESAKSFRLWVKDIKKTLYVPNDKKSERLITIVGYYENKPSNLLKQRMKYAKSALKYYIKKGSVMFRYVKASPVNLSDIYFSVASDFPEVYIVEKTK
jgi:hypothetical protein